jgi:ATP synthase protein I
MKNLKEISTRLEIAKKKIKKRQVKKNGSNAASLGRALKISTELIAAVAVGTTLGFILDNWLDTRPWLTISFFFMGVAAGILNVIKSAKNMHKNFEK